MHCSPSLNDAHWVAVAPYLIGVVRALARPFPRDVFPEPSSGPLQAWAVTESLECNQSGTRTWSGVSCHDSRNQLLPYNRTETIPGSRGGDRIRKAKKRKALDAGCWMRQRAGSADAQVFQRQKHSGWLVGQKSAEPPIKRARLGGTATGDSDPVSLTLAAQLGQAFWSHFATSFTSRASFPILPFIPAGR